MSTTVYLVMDQHGLQHRRYFAQLADAQAYGERLRTKPDNVPETRWLPMNTIVVPTVVWDSLTECDEAPQ
jgi:hypothetical protein